MYESFNKYLYLYVYISIFPDEGKLIRIKRMRICFIAAPKHVILLNIFPGEGKIRRILLASKYFQLCAQLTFGQI